MSRPAPASVAHDVVEPAAEEAVPKPVSADYSKSAVHDEATIGHLPRREAQWDALCGRGHQDVVTERLCASRDIASLAELQRVLGIGFVSGIGNGAFGNPAFAFLSHSTSLTGRAVSPLNPRVFVFTDPATPGPIAGPPVGDPDFVALAFARGEPLVELVARDRVTKELRFFLVRFELACEEDGCDPWDLYGPSIESGWRGVSVFDGEDLENTVFDCNVCHQPGGPGTKKMLRMSQQRFPWTHFFRGADQGKELVEQYYTAHDRKETYGGVPGQLVSWSEPARLEGLVEHEGFIEQPGELPTMALAKQIARGRPLAAEPAYAAIFAASQAGTGVTVPFFDAHFVDKKRVTKEASVFRATYQGKAEPAAYVAPADLHKDEAAWRAGLRPEPGASGREIIVQMCARCHNGSLDQSVSRARFDAVDLDRMEPAELALAVARMRLADDSPLKMPPPRFGSLTDEEIDRAQEALLE